MTLKSIFSIALISIFLLSCSSNPLDVDVSDITVDMKYENVHHTLMHSAEQELISEHDRFQSELGEIYDYNIGYCIGLPEGLPDSGFVSRMMEYRKDESIQAFEKAIDDKFRSKQKIESKITDGFKHLKYHLPEAPMPTHIVYMNSLLRSGVFCTEEQVGIGLEWFLGEDNEQIKKLDPSHWFQWMKKGMDAKYLERDVLLGWIETHLIEESEGNLAEQMIRWGKVLYMTKAAFPEAEDGIIMRYDQEGIQWAQQNEFDLWKYLVDQKMLFKTDEMVILNMIGPGPMTPGLPQEGSPDRMGQFMGYQMVKNYMEKNEVSIKQLIKTPYNDILQQYDAE